MSQMSFARWCLSVLFLYEDNVLGTGHTTYSWIKGVSEPRVPHRLSIEPGSPWLQRRGAVALTIIDNKESFSYYVAYFIWQ